MDRTFSSEFRVLNSGTEIPPEFTAWTSLAAVSAALGRRIWIDMGPFKIYPNLYVILIAASGRMRKSTSIGVARSLLEEMTIPPNLISQKITPEALIDAMRVPSNGVGTSPVVHLGGAKGTTTDAPIGQGFVVTDELTNFINHATMDNNMGQMLIEFYDCQRRFGYQTKSRGKEYIRDTSLGILAGTTPEELRRAIPESAIGAGFASRVLFIYVDSPSPPIAFPTYTPRQQEAREFCIRALDRISTLSGEVKLDSECRKWCEECYNKRCYTSPLYDDPSTSGYASRRYVHILKLSMNLMLAMGEQQTLTPQLLERAELLIEHNEKYLPKIVQLVSMNEKGSVLQYVLSQIRKGGKAGISREELMKLCSHRIDTKELTDITETLNKSNDIQVVANGAKILYYPKY